MTCFCAGKLHCETRGDDFELRGRFQTGLPVVLFPQLFLPYVVIPEGEIGLQFHRAFLSVNKSLLKYLLRSSPSVFPMDGRRLSVNTVLAEKVGGGVLRFTSCLESRFQRVRSGGSYETSSELLAQANSQIPPFLKMLKRWPLRFRCTIRHPNQKGHDQTATEQQRSPQRAQPISNVARFHSRHI